VIEQTVVDQQSMGCLFPKPPAETSQPAASASQPPKPNNAPAESNKNAAPEVSVEDDGEVPVPEAFQVKVLSLVRKEVVGKGSSGNVRKAEDPESGKTIALKIMPITLKGTDAENVMKQLTDLYGSQHPHVASFHGAAYDPDRQSMLIAFEYFDRRSIKDVLHRCGKFPEHVMATCCTHVVTGLNYLHGERRIMHRDVKPSNILVNSRGVFKIADFGMSKELGENFSAGQTWVGTSLYMSPERVQGLNYSFSADIWSLGIVVVEACTGKSPFEGTKGVDILDAIVDNPPPTLAQDTFSSHACDFVSLCLVKNDESRPGCDVLITHPFITATKKGGVRAWLASIP